MVAKCPKCESTDFSIVKREDKLFCYVACKKCGAVIGVLEDIDFKERYKTIIDNQQGVDRHIAQFELMLDKIINENKESHDIAEHTNAIVCQMSKKLR